MEKDVVGINDHFFAVPETDTMLENGIYMLIVVDRKPIVLLDWCGKKNHMVIELSSLNKNFMVV
ncbi:MAG: hypothetical protein Q8O99_01785 [bacterium]|nr:hypothetical protein [bacterium]